MAPDNKKSIADHLREIIYPAERLAIFVDGANLAGTIRTLSDGVEEEKWSIDFTLLRKEFGKYGRLIRPYYFTALKDSGEYDSVRKLADFLESNGWAVITKPVKYVGPHGSNYTIKGNMDTELTIYMLKMASFVDHMILFSGDGDFRALVEELQDRGKRVTVVSTQKAKQPVLAADLRRQADNFVDLADLKPLILRDPRERTKAMLAATRTGNDEIDTTPP